jgi:hypothetical protein
MIEVEADEDSWDAVVMSTPIDRVKGSSMKSW